MRHIATRGVVQCGLVTRGVVCDRWYDQIYFSVCCERAAYYYT